MSEAEAVVESSSPKAVAAEVVVGAPGLVEISGKGGGAEHDDSDVFVCRRSADVSDAEAAAAASVTLFVYGWHNVEPGPLSWAFPSLRAALDAVRTMRNAVQWCICSGAEWASVEAARAEGAVLVEQIG